MKVRNQERSGGAGLNVGVIRSELRDVLGGGGELGNLQNYCRCLLEMPEFPIGWYCGRWVVGVGGAKEFENLFHGLGFGTQRSSLPGGFADACPMPISNYPQWGTCPP